VSDSGILFLKANNMAIYEILKFLSIFSLCATFFALWGGLLRIISPRAGVTQASRISAFVKKIKLANLRFPANFQDMILSKNAFNLLVPR
jgi:hypothetical protein